MNRLLRGIVFEESQKEQLENLYRQTRENKKKEFAAKLGEAQSSARSGTKNLPARPKLKA